MKKTLILYFFILQLSFLHADNSKFISIEHDGTIQTISGTIYRLFQGEIFEIDSKNALKAFSDRALIHNINGSYEIQDKIDNNKFVLPKITLKKDKDSLYVQIKKTSGLEECLLINQNRNTCFAKLGEKEFGKFIKYSLDAIRCDSCTILRIAPKGFLSITVPLVDIKGICEKNDSSIFILTELSVIKTCNRDTISFFKTSRKEPYNQNVHVSHFPMYVSIFVIIILLGIILLLQWKRIHSNKEVPSHKKKYHIESSQKEILVKEINVLGMENDKCKATICELKCNLEKVKKNACISEEREKAHCKMIKELNDELEKNKKRLYSLEIRLNKAEYDKHQLEMEILRYKEDC